MVEHNISQDRQAGLDGWGYRMDFYRDVEVFGRTISTNIGFGGHDGEFGLEPEAVSFARLTLTTPIRKIKGATISPYLMGQWGAGGMAENMVVGGIGITW